MKFIHVKGAKQHNLKNIDLDIPRDKLTVITGLSGSGKTRIAKKALQELELNYSKKQN